MTNNHFTIVSFESQINEAIFDYKAGFTTKQELTDSIHYICIEAMKLPNLVE